MADTWTARVATAAGAAAGTGAAQLGLGYGLGVVVWPADATLDDSAWLGSLGWAVWIAASATVFGAVLGSRLHGGPGPRASGPWRFALAACAALGALVSVALVALPARSAVRVDTLAPQVVAGGYAAIGLALGLIIAFWAVSSRPVALNLVVTAIWLWALAITAVVVELTVHRDSATFLTRLPFAEVAGSGRHGIIHWPSALLTLCAALVIGVLAVLPAVRRGDFGARAATSGAAGPLLVACAFLALAPRLTGALGPLQSAYLIAPYAVLAGLAGSAVAVAAGRAVAERRATTRAAAGEPAAGEVVAVPASTGHAHPGRAKLPAQPTGPSSAIAPPGDLGAPGAPTRSGDAVDTSERSADARSDLARSGESVTARSDPARSGESVTARSDQVRPGHIAAGAAGSGALSERSSAGASAAEGGTGSGGPSGAVTGMTRARTSSETAHSPTDAAASPATPRTAGRSARPTGAAESPPTPRTAGRPARQTGAAESPARPPAGDRTATPAGGRSGRPRARKAATPDESSARGSTVTPPPTAPSVARINPEQPSAG